MYSAFFTQKSKFFFMNSMNYIIIWFILKTEWIFTLCSTVILNLGLLTSGQVPYLSIINKTLYFLYLFTYPSTICIRVCFEHTWYIYVIYLEMVAPILIYTYVIFKKMSSKFHHVFEQPYCFPAAVKFQQLTLYTWPGQV